MWEGNKIFKKYCTAKNPDTKAILHTDFRKLRNLIILKIEEFKQKYYESYFKENIANASKTWDGIKSLVTLKKTNCFTPKSVSSNNVTVTDPHDVATAFNNFFVSIGPDIAKSIPKTSSKIENLKNVIPNSLFLSPTDRDEIRKIILSLDKKKSTGPCSIPTHILKDNANILAQPLSTLINQSFAQGLFPDILKVAKLIPVFK